MSNTREVFRGQHDASKEIVVKYDAATRLLFIYINGVGKYHPAQPGAVTQWFTANSRANVEKWQAAYWSSGLTGNDFGPVAAAIAPATPNGETDAQRATRQRNNELRLRKMYPTLRPRVQGILADMESLGWRPQIDIGVYRTPAEQAAKVRQGFSKVSYSYHNVTGENGAPESLAADIVDTRYGWDAPSKYWLQLASCAEARGMATGIRWGLSTPQRAAINLLIRMKNWGAKYAMGWDAAHCEVVGVSIGAAKRGIRPK